MSDDIEINIDALRIGDLPALVKAGRNELPPEELVALLERVAPGCSDLPLRRLHEIVTKINEALTPPKN